MWACQGRLKRGLPHTRRLREPVCSWTAVSGATIRGVTAKEKLHKRVEGLSEEEAERLLAALEGGPAKTVDDWGDLSAFHEVAFAETMRRLAEEEGAVIWAS